jgi:alpha-D-xyloside xylohydrolase
MFLEAKNALVFKKGNETLMIEPWGANSFRVRSTMEPNFIDRDWALTEKINHGNAKISVTEQGASIINGKIEAKVNNNGIITFFKDGVRILHEYHRSYDPSATKESCCTKPLKNVRNIMMMKSVKSIAIHFVRNGKKNA